MMDWMRKMREMAKEGTEKNHIKIFKYKIKIVFVVKMTIHLCKKKSIIGATY